MSTAAHSLASSQVSSQALQRTACDRCRHHKLKCIREHAGAEQCRRCIRANESCFTSPARKAGRPQRLFRSQSPASSSNGMLQTPPASTHNASPASIGDALVATYDGPLAGSGSLGSLAADVNDPISHITRRSECMKTLGTLHSEILHDLDMAKGCHIAPECIAAFHESGLPDPNPDFMVGRILNHTKTLLDILDIFDLSHDAAPYGTERGDAGLFCDTPVLFSLMNCYVILVRTFRTTFACLHESIPYFLDLTRTGTATADRHMQLLPNLDFGGFKLTGRIDLQLQVFVQVTEDMLSKLDAKFGMDGAITTRRWNTTVVPNKATAMLWMMLEQENAEQPPLDKPRGHCGSLKEIFAAIRKELHMDNEQAVEQTNA